jgi:hypothetical protein
MLLELLLKQCRPWLCPVAVWHRNLFAWRIVVCPIFVLPIMAMMAPLLLYFTGDGRREDISGTGETPRGLGTIRNISIPRT